jgi:hypothetical protein
MISPTPFVCDMTALSSEQRARHHELAVLLQSSLAAVHELPDGYDFEFPWSPADYEALTEITRWSTHAARFSISVFELRVKSISSAGD